MSTRRLGVETIDIYYLHGGQATDAPFEDQVGTLAELREQGVIRHVGLSNVTVEQFQAARAIVDIAATTAHYNLTNRLGGQLLAAAENAGVMFSPWHPATIDGDDTRAAVAKIAKRHHATPKQVASPGTCTAPPSACRSQARPASTTSARTSPPHTSNSHLTKSSHSPPCDHRRSISSRTRKTNGHEQAVRRTSRVGHGRRIRHRPRLRPGPRGRRLLRHRRRANREHAGTDRRFDRRIRQLPRRRSSAMSRSRRWSVPQSTRPPVTRADSMWQ